MRVSEIRVKRIRVNQGLGVFNKSADSIKVQIILESRSYGIWLEYAT